ncbi:MAG TPA: hypothetical protein VFE11_13345, partial [Dongiaceae bacterium]|nr:hypothetical protein [Dongiaceae bacterium]
MVAFGLAAGDADGAAAADLGKLPDQAADRARRGRDHNRLARLRLADVIEPDPGRGPGHPDDAEIGGEGKLPARDLAQAAAVARRIELPAEPADDEIAHPVVRMAGV